MGSLDGLLMKPLRFVTRTNASLHQRRRLFTCYSHRATPIAESGCGQYYRAFRIRSESGSVWCQ